MYRLLDEYGNIVDELVNPSWLKQQRLVDRPISANSCDEADGVVLSDGETMVGIAGRNMQNYEPLVTVVEVSSDPYIFQRMSELESQIKAAQDGISQVYDAQTVGMVSKTELDEAYREGVNSVG